MEVPLRIEQENVIALSHYMVVLIVLDLSKRSKRVTIQSFAMVNGTARRL